MNIATKIISELSFHTFFGRLLQTTPFKIHHTFSKITTNLCPLITYQPCTRKAPCDEIYKHPLAVSQTKHVTKRSHIPQAPIVLESFAMNASVIDWRVDS